MHVTGASIFVCGESDAGRWSGREGGRGVSGTSPWISRP